MYSRGFRNNITIIIIIAVVIGYHISYAVGKSYVMHVLITSTYILRVVGLGALTHIV